MGGRKREEDRSDVLARARKERAAREANRIRTSAALNVQRWWRGRAVAAKVPTVARDDTHSSSRDPNASIGML